MKKIGEMHPRKRPRKIQFAFFGLLILLIHQTLWAAPTRFFATVEPKHISLKGTVTLILTVEYDEDPPTGEPKFNAPQFKTEYSSQSFFSQSELMNGHLSTVKKKVTTIVLRPSVEGNLRISDINVELRSLTLKSPDLIVDVNSRNSKVQPPSQVQKERESRTGNQVLLRGEIEKKKAYRGEQVIVSYYLYHQPKIFNLQVEKYPILKGFLREDLEFPTRGTQLEEKTVEFEGETYERTLLARYAAYPLEEGKLNLDTMALSYLSVVDENSEDDLDPFFGYLRRLTPKPGRVESDLLSLEVIPLPVAGKPVGFTGVVGEFNVSAAMNKNEVHANEPVTLTIKLEGKGNLSSMQLPKIQWPKGIEIYDSKAKTEMSKSGIAEKIFEILMIPRIAGNFEFSQLEFSFFNPSKKQYESIKPEPQNLRVLESLGGDSQVTPPPIADEKKEDTIYGLKNGVSDSKLEKNSPSTKENFVFNVLFAANVVIFGYFLFLVVSNNLKKRRNSKELISSLDGTRWKEEFNLLINSMNSASSKTDRFIVYNKIAQKLIDRLQITLEVPIREKSRAELKQILMVEKSLNYNYWKKLEEMLDRSDQIQFAGLREGPNDDINEINFKKWVEDAQTLIHFKNASGDSKN